MTRTAPIHVTRPALAPLERYTSILEGVWQRGVLTHNGPLVQQLERELADKLKVPSLVAVTNGTVALQLAIRALGLKGEIITTPFTWIATVSAIIAEGCTPVFADIDPATFNLCPNSVRRKITKNTVAILPVHVFSNPCDLAAFSALADAHKLKLIYDGAHAFDVCVENRSLATAGDITALSFHATKLYNTGEGGACVTLDEEIDARIRRLRFFGHNADKDVVENGYNGKMTEIHAALGLANLSIHAEVAAKRRRDYEHYVARLKENAAICFQHIEPDAYNFSYMPVVFASDELLNRAIFALESEGIVPRRYFYPAVNTYTKILPYQSMPIAEDLANRILCLPHYYDLGVHEIDRICDIVMRATGAQ